MRIYLDATISNLNPNIERNQLILLVERVILHNIDFKSELAEVPAPNEHGHYIDQNHFYCAENTVMLWNINFEDNINLVRNPNAMAIITSAHLNQLWYGGFAIYESVKKLYQGGNIRVHSIRNTECMMYGSGISGTKVAVDKVCCSCFTKI